MRRISVRWLPSAVVACGATIAQADNLTGHPIVGPAVPGVALNIDDGTGPRETDHAGIASACR